MLGTDTAQAGFAAALRTDVGKVRKENEDSIVAHGSGRLWAVADGMGGHTGGAWASQTVCAAVAACVLTGDLDGDCERVADVLADANDHIVAKGLAAGSTIGTTVVALLAAGDRVACLWAGDSRIYRYRQGRLRQLTRDHSQVAELVAAGLITEEESRTHPLGNVVTRAIGVAPGLALDVVEDGLLPGDLFLLCSDGLTKCLDDAEIGDVLGAFPLRAACDTLLAQVLERGAPDNVSVILVQA